MTTQGNLKPAPASGQQLERHPDVVRQLTYTPREVCTRLQISRPTYYVQRRRGTFPIPEILPRVSPRAVRFSVALVERYVSGASAPRVGRGRHGRRIAR